MPSSTEIPAVVPSTNGELINRVQQLRLDDQLGRGSGRASRGSWLPWVLCGLMAIAWVGVGVRYYRAPRAEGDGGRPARARMQRRVRVPSNRVNPPQRRASFFST